MTGITEHRGSSRVLMSLVVVLVCAVLAPRRAEAVSAGLRSSGDNSVAGTGAVLPTDAVGTSDASSSLLADAAGPETADWAPFRGTVELWCTKRNPSQWGTCSSHHSYDAIDIGMAPGTPVYAAGPGTVVDFNNTCLEGDSSCSGGRGRFVTIQHPDGRRSRYLHLSMANVRLNQTVRRGEQIGLSGNTGSTTAPHLHYDEQDASGTNIDPGPMKALHGSIVEEYPRVVGYTSWWETPYGTQLRNDGFVRPPGVGDFTGDGRAELAVYDLGSGRWKTQGEPDVLLGGPGYAPVPADYDGDGLTDRAVYDLTNGVWKTVGQSDVSAGGSGFLPVPGDYDGDGRWERAVYELRTGIWKIPGQGDVAFGGPGAWPVPGDYDGDGTWDLAVYDAKPGLWKVRGRPDVAFGGPGQVPVPGDYNAGNGWEMATYSAVSGVWHVEGQADLELGGSGQVPVPSDRDGDGKVEPAVYQPATGAWTVAGQAAGTLGGPRQVPVSSPWPWSAWALATANSVNTDLLGDATSDAVVFRPTVGQWLTPGQPGTGFGQAGDIPLLGDLDGDGRADRTVFRPSVGIWFTEASGWLPFQVTSPQDGDVPLLADVTGDRRVDPMIYRPSTGQLFTVNVAPAVIGVSGDVPVTGDLDGDLRTEVGVFRPSTGQWLFPGRPTLTFGQAGDVPVLADVDGDHRADRAVFRPSTGLWFVALDGWWPFTY
ncbi:MAG: VCBS repeat domain-containing M23 family metallopeptidase, partial [Acidimicrobiales bacterium]|nr:VCBS repeat domain-containing M23 family metallopeptidase [Acidimicrobiales bacterium]